MGEILFCIAKQIHFCCLIKAVHSLPVFEYLNYGKPQDLFNCNRQALVRFSVLVRLRGTSYDGYISPNKPAPPEDTK